jgi:hypothetical protein
MGFLLDKPLFAAAFGLVGGPVVYYGGWNLGALTLGEPMWLSLTLVGVVWAVVLPLIYAVSRQIERRLAHAGVES